MFQNYQMLFFIVFCILINNGNLFSQFYGDMELQAYINKEICLKFDHKLLTIFVLNFNFFNHIQPPFKNSFYSKYKHCFHMVFNNVSSDTLLEVISKNVKFQTILILFDLTYLVKPHLKKLIINLDKLYFKCNKCIPFILILNYQINFKINNSIFQFLTLTKSDFRSIILIKNTSIHIRPVLNGCLLYSKIFIPKTKNDFKMLKMSKNKCNLNKTILNVSVVDQPPFCHVLNVANKTTIFGTHYTIDSDILEYLKLKFNFKTFLINANSFFELRFNITTKKYEGLVGHVYGRQAHIGMCALSKSFERLKYVEFTYSTHSDTISFLTIKPNFASQTWLVSSPFDLFVWITIFVIFIFTSLMLYLLNYLKHSTIPLVSIFTFLFGNLLMRSVDIQKFEKHIYTAQRLIVAFWMLSMLILNTSYSAKFFSKLTVREYDSPVDTCQNLLDYFSQNKLYLLTANFFKNAFIKATDKNDIYYKLGQYINKTQLETVSPNIFNMTTHITKHWTNFVYIDKKIILINIVNYFGFDKMHISKENMGLDDYGIALTKKSTLLLPFNFA